LKLNYNYNIKFSVKQYIFSFIVVKPLFFWLGLLLQFNFGKTFAIQSDG